MNDMIHKPCGKCDQGIEGLHLGEQVSGYDKQTGSALGVLYRVECTCEWTLGPWAEDEFDAWQRYDGFDDD